MGITKKAAGRRGAAKNGDMKDEWRFGAKGQRRGTKRKVGEGRATGGKWGEKEIYIMVVRKIPRPKIKNSDQATTGFHIISYVCLPGS